MIIEIDQSGKIENTSKNTIIAFSNHIFESVIIKAKDKREIQKIFRKIGKPRIFVYRLFAVIVFILIKPYLNKIEQIIIDEEYPGNLNLIKNFLLQEIRRSHPNFQTTKIIFRKIGKKSRAHYLAYGTAIDKKLPDKIISAKKALKIMIK